MLVLLNVTKMTLQSYEGATGASYNSKTMLNVVVFRDVSQSVHSRPA